MNVGSLFAGIGGIDIAFEQAGYSILWAIENDAACCRTFQYNYPGIKLLKEDVRCVDPSILPKVDVLVAGFPCQPFSVAGKQRGFSDPRGHLFYGLCKYIDAQKPRFVFLENVANLLVHDDGKTFLTIYNTLLEMGYYVRYRVLRASEYGGVPQIRDRIYIIAFKDPNDCDRFTFPEKIKLATTIDQVVNRKEKKHEVYYYDKSDPFYAKAISIVKQRNSIYRVYHDSIKITQHKMCPTLTASMGTQKNQVPLVADDFGIRKLTVQECLDFQGFPRSFHFPRSVTLDDAYKQIGNSVCVPVITRIAQSIKACCGLKTL